MHEFSPHFKMYSSIFSMRMGLEWAPSPRPSPVLSKDKLLTSVKAFLINRGIRHGMSSGVQRLLIKGGGETSHTSPLVHLSGQSGTFPPECPRQRPAHQATISSHTPSGAEREAERKQCSSEGAAGGPDAGREEEERVPGSRGADWGSRSQVLPCFWAATGMSIYQAIPQSKE